MRQWRAICVVIALLSGGGGMAFEVAPASSASTLTASLPALHLAFFKKFHVTTDGGYKLYVEARVYKGFRAGSRLPALPYSTRHRLRACHAVRGTDLVIPVGVALVDRTRGFRQSMALKFPGFGINSNVITGVDADYVLGNGAQCGSAFTGDLVDAKWAPMRYGGVGSLGMFIVIHGYFSPRYPHGYTKLRGLKLLMSFFGGPQGNDPMSTAGVDIRLL